MDPSQDPARESVEPRHRALTLTTPSECKISILYYQRPARNRGRDPYRSYHADSIRSDSVSETAAVLAAKLAAPLAIIFEFSTQ